MNAEKVNAEIRSQLAAEVRAAETLRVRVAQLEAIVKQATERMMFDDSQFGYQRIKFKNGCGYYSETVGNATTHPELAAYLKERGSK